MPPSEARRQTSPPAAPAARRLVEGRRHGNVEIAGPSVPGSDRLRADRFESDVGPDPQMAGPAPQAPLSDRRAAVPATVRADDSATSWTSTPPRLLPRPSEVATGDAAASIGAQADFLNQASNTGSLWPAPARALPCRLVERISHASNGKCGELDAATTLPTNSQVRLATAVDRSRNVWASTRVRLREVNARSPSREARAACAVWHRNDASRAALEPVGPPERMRGRPQQRSQPRRGGQVEEHSGDRVT